MFSQASIIRDTLKIYYIITGNRQDLEIQL